MIPVGLTLAPEAAFLELLEEVILTRIDYAEITPETTWRLDADGALVPNDFHDRFAALVARAGIFTVAHGVGLSLGGAALGGAASATRTDGAGHGADGSRQDRRARWLERVHADQQVFGFRWYSEHLGATSVDDVDLVLPVPLPMTEVSVARVQARLAAMRTVVPRVGVENSAFYFLFGEPLDEADFLARIVDSPGCHLVLDLHNLHTLAVNFGADPLAYLARLPLERVIEIHISGGSDSDAGWLGGAVMRLDSHDHAVPEAVWDLLAAALPRCPNLRGITLERIEGTVGPDDVPVLAAELARARAMGRARGWAS